MPGTALTCKSSAASTLLNLPEPRDAGRCYIFTGAYLFLVLFRSRVCPSLHRKLFCFQDTSENRQVNRKQNRKPIKIAALSVFLLEDILFNLGVCEGLRMGSSIFPSWAQLTQRSQDSSHAAGPVHFCSFSSLISSL